MIYSRFGGQVKIIGKCGEHQPAYLNFPLSLAKVQIYIPEEDKTLVCYRFITDLRADEGLNEIMSNYEATPVVRLSDAELKMAFKEAA